MGNLVAHYWELGEYISRKIANAEWGDGIVEDLAADLARRYPGVRGYTRRNLFRMRQFFEAYRAHKKVSPLVSLTPASGPETRAHWQQWSLRLRTETNFTSSSRAHTHRHQTWRRS